jgi:hypothetical protein
MPQNVAALPERAITAGAAERIAGHEQELADAFRQLSAATAVRGYRVARFIVAAETPPNEVSDEVVLEVHVVGIGDNTSRLALWETLSELVASLVHDAMLRERLGVVVYGADL